MIWGIRGGKEVLLAGIFTLLLRRFLTFVRHVTLLIAIVAMRRWLRVVGKIEVFQLNGLFIPENGSLLGGV